VYYATNTDGNKIVAAFVDLGNKPSGSSSDTLYGMVTALDQNVKVDDVYYNKYTVWTGENTVIYTKDTFAKGDFVYFDKSSDDLYAAGEVKALSGITAWIVEYEESDKVLTYTTSYGGTEIAKAVDSDVQIVYVNKADNKAGDEIGVNKYDQVTGYANAIIKDVDSDGKIDVIIVDSNYDVLDADASATYSAVVSTPSIAATVNSPAYTVSVTPTTAAKDATLTVSVTPTTAVVSGTDTLTITCTGNASKEITFENSDGTSAKTVDFTMPAGAATISVSVAHTAPVV
jgi:hypothetical protein